MDVTFTNVLEGARQYFQGLPTATAAADSPFYQHHQQQQASLHQQATSQQHTPSQHQQVTSQPQVNQHQQVSSQQQHSTSQHQQLTNQQHLTSAHQQVTSQQQANQHQQVTSQQPRSTGQHQKLTNQQQPTSQHQQVTNQQQSNQHRQVTSQQQHPTSQHQQVSSQLLLTRQHQQVSSQLHSPSQHQQVTSQPHSTSHLQQITSQQPTQQQSNQQHSSNQQYQSNQSYASLQQQQSSQQLYVSQQQLSQQYASQQQSPSRPHGLPNQIGQPLCNSAGPPASQSPWADQNRPPTRERTPVQQRSSSQSSDGSRPPSHHSQQFQTQEVSRQYQNPYQKEAAQQISPQESLPFNFSQPQSREPYRSQVATSSTYHQPVSPQLGRYSSKEPLAQPVQNYQYSPSTGYPKSQYGYPQGQYYPQAHTQTKNSTGYKPPTSEPYPTSAQRLNPYLQVTNNDRFNQSQRYPMENSRAQVSLNQSSNQPIETSYRSSHTHNLPPIAALSSYHSSKSNQSKEQTVHTSSSYSRDVANSYTNPNSSVIKPNENQRPESFPSVASSIAYSQEQRTNASHSQPTHQNYSHTNTVTTNSYSSVIMSNVSSNNVQSNQSTSNSQSYYHGPNKAFIKNSEDYYHANNQSLNQTSRLPITQSIIESKSVPVIKENPLDLSVKTVKTTADSTLQEIESSYKLPQSQRSNLQENSSNHMYPTFDMQKNLTKRTQPPPVLTAPKVDFHPKFNIPTANHQIHPSENQNVTSNRHFQKPTPSSHYNVPYRYPEVTARLAPGHQLVNSNSYQYGNLPARNVPPSTHSTPEQNHNLTPPYHLLETNKKRPAEVTSSVIPEKVPKVETWRQSIDLQIEQKLSSYKQQQENTQHSPSSRSTMNANGNYPSTNARNIYSFNQREPYKSSAPQQSQSIPYTHHQTNHSQTYVPSPNAHQYQDYNHLPKHINNHYINPYAASLNPMLPPNLNKQQIPGSVDRKTLSLLRNSIETKEQKKIEQMKTQENLPLHPRPEIQHSNTDVTAPLQPKLGVVGRNNVSPFTPTSFPETNMASMYKLNPQKSTGPVINHQTQLKDLLKFEENNTVIVNNAHSGSDYDGLAAFLAARIRTKGELKQVGPNNTAVRNARVQMYVNEQIKSPPPPLFESPVVQNSSLNSTNSSADSISPPKLLKENSPRKKLFCKTEEEQSSNNNLPPRDKSGIRSSSETSVFDFDDDDDNQMPVLERQSLEAMRRDRRSSLKLTSTPLLDDIKEEDKLLENLLPPSRTPSPFDEIFDSICDNFVDYLKNGPKKRSGKKKKDDLEIPVPIKAEPNSEHPVEAKLENLDFTAVEIKKELMEEEVDTTENNNRIETTIILHKIGILSDSDLSDVDAKNEKQLSIRNKNRVRRKILSSSESSDDEGNDEKTEKTEEKVETDTANENASQNHKEVLETKETAPELIKPADIKQEKVDLAVEIQLDESSVSKEEPPKKLDTLTVIRPAKKPCFGTGSEFCQPGWEEDVFKYKKSLRMPRSLIQVTRPPNSRLSTSLPDLDPPCPPSPTPSMASMATDSEAPKDCNNKKLIKKFKSEPIDSDSESTTSFNIFSKKMNYDSEESSSSLPNTRKEKTSILDKLLEKCGGRKKRKYNRKDDHSPKLVPKSDNNLLATPGFEASEKDSPVKDKKIKGPILSEKSAILNFRKDTINNFKDAFIKSNNTVIHNKFATVVLTSRTRKETKALKQRATIKEVFGAERPASAPPCEVTAMNNVKIKKEVLENTEFSIKLNTIQKEAEVNKEIKVENEKEKDCDNKNKNDPTLLEELDDKQIKQEVLDDSDGERKLIEFVIKRDPDAKYETTSLDSEEGIINKRRNKLGKLRKKFSSGFDYIRKKKKIKKESSIETTDIPCVEKKKRLSNKTLESVDDIQKEIKTWVLNKGIGESHLHRAARLGYNDITAYCLEKMDCHPSPKDNAGYTPLHEACSRGHLQIAKLLLMYGANVHESAQGGIRPLHMAVENGYVEIVRLLLSYGADPSLGTYAGMTPISLANDEGMKDLLLHHLADKGADRGPPWHFRGPASCFDDLEDLGYNIFESPPKIESEHELDDIEFEVSDSMLPNLYTIRGEPVCDKWVLLQDLSNYLKVKSRDTLLRQISPTSEQANAKSLIRELKMSDFLDQARCCQFLNQGEKLNTRSNKIALVKFTDKVKQLLGIESVTVSR